MSCSNLAKSGIGTTDIGTIQPKWDSPFPVYLQGTVVQQAPFLGSRAYKLQDNTGAIWVVTQNPEPQLGAQVVIKGTVRYQSISVAGQDLGEVFVLEEEQLDSASDSQNITLEAN